MNKQEETKIFKKVLKYKTVEHQNIKLKEEISELLTENIRIETGRNKPNSPKLIEEQADSIIMIKQWFYNHGGKEPRTLNYNKIDSLKSLNYKICLIINNNLNYNITSTITNLRYIYDYIVNYTKKHNTEGLLNIAIESKLKKLEERTLTGDL
jgi:hypothetical protein